MQSSNSDAEEAEKLQDEIVFLLFLWFLFQSVPVCVYMLHFKFQGLDAALLRI